MWQIFERFMIGFGLGLCVSYGLWFFFSWMVELWKSSSMLCICVLSLGVGLYFVFFMGEDTDKEKKDDKLLRSPRG